MSAHSENNSKNVLAIVLIVIGGLWLLHHVGLSFRFPDFHNLIFPFRNAFHDFWHFIFSWPVLLIIIGLILLAGKRSTSGLVLIIVGGVFLIPRIFIIPGLTTALIIPLVLVGIGILLIARII